MPAPRPENEFQSDGISFSFDHTPFDATSTRQFFTTERKFRVTKMTYINEAGFTGHASNHWTISVRNASTVMASYTTDSDITPGGTIAAATPVAGTLSATDASRVVNAGTALTVVFTKAASAVALPSGRVVIHGTYL